MFNFNAPLAVILFHHLCLKDNKGAVENEVLKVYWCAYDELKVYNTSEIKYSFGMSLLELFCIIVCS